MEEETTNPDDISGQSKVYDKIVKENMREVLPMLVKDILGINIISREDLPESLQQTRETVPDQLSKITDDKGETYILHIEWQSNDDPSMDHRMLSYRAMLRKKYGLPVKQYVIFLAPSKSKMPYIIDEENLKFSYNLISLQQYSHKIFLNSSLPEQKIMAIFGNFENEGPVDVIKEILEGIEQHADGEINCQRYREQLRGLIQLRKLGKEFRKAMGTITKFKVEKDPFYQDGVKIGREKGRHEEALEIANEMKKEKFPVEKIAKITKLSVEVVESL